MRNLDAATEILSISVSPSLRKRIVARAAEEKRNLGDHMKTLLESDAAKLKAECRKLERRIDRILNCYSKLRQSLEKSEGLSPDNAARFATRKLIRVIRARKQSVLH
jgi:hypothetical protein